jgi:hypothetical protein
MEKQKMAKILIELKIFGDNVILFKSMTDKSITEIAEILFKNQRLTFLALKKYLNEDLEGVG